MKPNYGYKPIVLKKDYKVHTLETSAVNTEYTKCFLRLQGKNGFIKLLEKIP